MIRAPFNQHLLCICALILLSRTGVFSAEPLPADGAMPAAAPLDYPALQRRVDFAMRRVDEYAEIEARLEEITASIPESNQDSGSYSANNSADVSNALAEARRQLAALVSDDMPASMSPADLDRQLAAARRERDDLTAKLAQLSQPKAEKNQSSGIPGTVVRTDREGIFVFLFRNRLVPMQAPYFTRRVGPGTNRKTGEQLQVATFHRASEGRAINDALLPDGLVDKIIGESKAGTDTHYFYIRVCSDSIPAFNTLCKALKDKGYDYAWDTDKDIDHVYPANNSSSPAQHDVRVTPATSN